MTRGCNATVKMGRVSRSLPRPLQNGAPAGQVNGKTRDVASGMSTQPRLNSLLRTCALLWRISVNVMHVRLWQLYHAPCKLLQLTTRYVAGMRRDQEMSAGGHGSTSGHCSDGA